MEERERTEFAAWLIAFRAHTQQSQKQLATVLGLTKKTITAWETGRHYPDWPKRLQLNQWARSVGYDPVPPKR